MMMVVTASGSIALFSLLALLTAIPLRAPRAFIQFAATLAAVASLAHGVFAVLSPSISSFVLMMLLAAGLGLCISGIYRIMTGADVRLLYILYGVALLIPAHVLMIASSGMSLLLWSVVWLWFAIVLILHAHTLAQRLTAVVSRPRALAYAWSLSVLYAAVAFV